MDRMRSRRPARAGAVALALSVAVLQGCDPGRSDASPAGEAPNVLLILVDTLGAQYVGCYGDRQACTPGIDALAAEGKRFERAYAAAPWTKPSVASLFTSRMPSVHGVRQLEDVLPGEATTLAELLQAQGFTTQATISHFLLRAEYGFDQGFGGFDDTSVAGHAGICAQRVTDAALGWLRQHRDGRFFLFAHYFDPHYAYFDHPQFHLTGSYAGPLRSGMPIAEIRARRGQMSPADLEYLRSLYREETAFTDVHVGRLLAGLEELSLARRTLVVFTADHGEEFMEHGWVGHTRSLYDELLRVPLILRLPGRIAPGVVSEPASLLDVLPTVAELLGLEREPAWEGRSLVPALDGRPASARELFAEVSFRPQSEGDPQAAQKTAYKTALLDPRWKLVHDRISGAYELYDRRSDPGEQRDRWGEDRALDEALRTRLDQWESAHRDSGAAPRRALDEGEQEELEKLGYGR